jgi:hypothetical protein
MSHVPFDIETINWDQFINTQDGGQRYFVGQRYMRGYGVLGSIGKFLLPIAKNLASTLGSEGVEAGQKILKDVTEGKDFSQALKEHSKKGLENLSEKIKQCGKGKSQAGRGRKRKRKTNTLGFNNPKLLAKNTKSKYQVKPSISMYPPRPNSPTPRSTQSTYTRRKRRPDQLDLF